MKIIVLEINQYTRPRRLVAGLKKQNLNRGDNLMVVSLLDDKMTFLIILVSLAFLYKLHKSGKDYGSKVLEDIFSNAGSKKIQREIEKQYGITVVIEAAKEDSYWQQFSKIKLVNAYGLNEPEYIITQTKLSD